MKIRKLKYITCLLLLAFVFTSIPAIAAVESNDFKSQFTYEDYLEQVELGYIAEDVSYEQLVELNKRASEKLQSQLDNDSMFTMIYTSDSFDMNSEDFTRTVSTLKPGDVFTMNSVASYGLTGHAALVISNNEILNIAGPSETTKFLTKSQFNSLYGGRNITLYRPNIATWGVEAATWADNEYRNNPASYQLGMDLVSTRPTYCSKIVYQAYRFGVGTESLWRIENYNLVHPQWLHEHVKIYDQGTYSTGV